MPHEWFGAIVSVLVAIEPRIRGQKKNGMTVGGRGRRGGRGEVMDNLKVRRKSRASVASDGKHASTSEASKINCT